MVPVEPNSLRGSGLGVGELTILYIGIDPNLAYDLIVSGEVSATLWRTQIL